MINYILMICVPSFIGLYILYRNKKHNLKIAVKNYLLFLYISNLTTLFIVYKVFKKFFNIGANFFLAYSILATIIVMISAKIIILNKDKFKIELKHKKTKLKKQQKIVSHLLLFITALVTGGFAYYKKHFTSATIENLFFGLLNNMQGTSLAVLKSIMIYVLIFSLIYYLILFIFVFPREYKLVIKFKNREFNLIPIGFLSKKVVRGSFLVLIITLLFASYQLKAYEFASSMISPGQIYEDYYVNPKEARLDFPENKKNIVHIILESVENSLFSKASGGGYQNSIIPELEELAKGNTSFSPDKSLISGLYVAPGCTWTAAAMVCQSSGVNLRHGISHNKSAVSILEGAYPLGKVLEKEGYNLEIIMGSDGAFNNRDLYYKTHGNHEILDLYEAINRGYLPEGYYNDWWGFEDSMLYEISKEELKRLAADDKPFAYTMLTVDTHFPQGYLDDGCEDTYTDPYLSSYACASSMLNEFIIWLQEQDFYKDTIIVITGDHLTMQDKMFSMIDYENRYIYNTIINSAKKADTTIRQGSSFDVFPTILSSMGVKIEGDRLGLGTDLYSKTLTLLEELGREKFDKETRAISNYYIENIVKAKKVK